jgi:hypothetical protein
LTFIRPELAERLRRWQEPIAWGAVLLAGLVMAWRGYRWLSPLPFALGLLLAAAGLGLLLAALRRVRLRAEGREAGVVMIDERRVGYFGPWGGGFIDIDELARVTVWRRADGDEPRLAWRLSARDGTLLTIPFGAEGAEALPDALSALPGLDLEAAVAARRAPGEAVVAVWERPH